MAVCAAEAKQDRCIPQSASCCAFVFLCRLLDISVGGLNQRCRRWGSCICMPHRAPDRRLVLSYNMWGCGRLLDDNRELFVPELQETVRPHPHFMLFATQNPAGAYGGRKVPAWLFI